MSLLITRTDSGAAVSRDGCPLGTIRKRGNEWVSVRPSGMTLHRHSTRQDAAETLVTYAEREAAITALINAGQSPTDARFVVGR